MRKAVNLRASEDLNSVKGNFLKAQDQNSSMSLLLQNNASGVSR